VLPTGEVAAVEELGGWCAGPALDTATGGETQEQAKSSQIEKRMRFHRGGVEQKIRDDARRN
jgi:hypothetical protein